MYIIFSKNVCKDRDGEDIEYEDETKKRRMRQKISALGNRKTTTRLLFHCQALKLDSQFPQKTVLFASLKAL